MPFCDQCGAKTSVAARFCGHCGNTVTEHHLRSRPNPDTASLNGVDTFWHVTGKPILITLAFVLLAFVLVIVFGNAGERDINLVVVVVFFATALWAATDSHRLRLSEYDTVLAASPTILLMWIVLLWLVTFPMYLSVRGKRIRGTLSKRDAKLVRQSGLGFGFSCTALIFALIMLGGALLNQIGMPKRSEIPLETDIRRLVKGSIENLQIVDCPAAASEYAVFLTDQQRKVHIYARPYSKPSIELWRNDDEGYYYIANTLEFHFVPNELLPVATYLLDNGGNNGGRTAILYSLVLRKTFSLGSDNYYGKKTFGTEYNPDTPEEKSLEHRYGSWLKSWAESKSLASPIRLHEQAFINANTGKGCKGDSCEPFGTLQLSYRPAGTLEQEPSVSSRAEDQRFKWLHFHKAGFAGIEKASNRAFMIYLPEDRWGQSEIMIGRDGFVYLKLDENRVVRYNPDTHELQKGPFPPPTDTDASTSNEK